MRTTCERAFRLTTLVLLLLVAAAVPEPAQAQLNVTGQWSTLPYLSPINPIHVALLKSGKVLIVAGSENNDASTVYKAAVWDPVAGTFVQQTTPWDLFCNGMSFLPDGRVIMTGGNLQYDPFLGPPWTTIFDPATSKFYRVEDMAKGRWYPSNTPLKDGGTMTFGGLDEQGATNTTTEIYDVGGGWSPPYPAAFTPGWYPRLHLLGNGKVFMGAPNPTSHTFDPEAGTWSTGGSTTNYGGDRLYGSSVLLPLKLDDGYAPKVIVFGGNTTLATDTVELIDLGNWPESWVTKPPMSVPRVTMNAVLLPNGKILTLGGSTIFNDEDTAHLNAETFDPVTETWTASGTMAYPRLYHSSALLLPDATVWVGGSNPNRTTWTPQMEIYKPPYLFTSTGALAARPTITSVTPVVGYGQTFTVTTPQASTISKVVMMRPGSNTHSFDQEARLIQLDFTQATSSTLSVTSPFSHGAAPPGYYMVFVFNAQGVPSVAKFFQITPNPTNQPPTATITAPSTSVTINAGQSVTFAGTASDPGGSIAMYSWVFPGGSPGKSNLQNPGAVTFATPGVYTVSLTVLDNLGANNPSPPTVTVTVNGPPELDASINTPPKGTNVSGIVTVNMSAANVQGSPLQFVLKLDWGTTLSSQTIASGSTATYSWNTAGLTGEHVLNLTVTDGAGRTASAHNLVTVGGGGGSGDTTPPVVNITSPGNGSAVSGTVSVTATATDNVSVSNVQFKLNGANLGSADTTAPYSVSWNTTGASAGAYTLTAVATDTSGLQTTSSPVTVTVGGGGGGGGTGPVVWTSVVNAAVTGGTLTKNAGCDGCFDAGGVSQQTIASGNGSVEFKVPSGVYVAAGLSTGNTGTTAQEIKWGLWFYPGTPGSVEVRESGVYKWDWPNVAGATHKVAVENGAVKYYLNGTLKYTSTVAPTYPLLLDAALGSGTAAVQTAVITSGSGGGGTDVTPPAVSITAPANNATVSGTVAVTATASDNVGVSNVQFKLNGANLGTADTTSPYSVSWNTGTVTPGTYTLTAVATDAAGNSTTSAPITVTKAGDATAPAVSITAPADGATVSGTVTITATASDNVGVKNVQFKVNGTNLGTPDTAAPYTKSWSAGTAAPGTYTLTAVASDAAGNTTTSAPITVTKPGADTTAPAISITAPAEGASVSGTVTVTATASDNVGVKNVQFKLNGANLGTADTTSPYSVSWNTTSAAPGTYTLTAVATDAAGNSTTSAAVSVTKPGASDTTAPAVSITAPAEGASVSGTVTVTATATDNVGVSNVQFKLNGANLGAADTTAPYSTSWNTTSAAPGTYTLTAVATDAAGNDTTSAAVTVTVGGGGGGGAQPVVWTAPVNVGVTGNTITKNAGCDGCFDAGAVSQQTILSGNGSAEFQVSAGSYVSVGLSNGNAGPAAEEIKFGLRFYPGTPGIVEVRESGAYKWDWLNAAGAVHKVSVEGGVVKYYLNGVLKYTSAVAPTYPLLLDASLGSAGSAVQNATITAASSAGSTAPPPDSTPPTVNITAPASGASVSGTVVVTATASDNVAVTNVQFQLDGANLGAADSTSPYSISWNTAGVAAGTHVLTAIATDAAGNTNSSPPVMVTVGSSGGSTAPPPGVQAVVWTAPVNVSASGNTITKVSGCDGCFDAGAVSQQTIASGDGYVEFSVSGGSYVSVGLSTSNGGPAADEIKFALRFYPGTPGIVEVRESGAYTWDWANVAGAVHKIAVEGGAVKYYLNGTLKYTSALAPTYPLMLDASLGSAASAVQNAMIQP